MKQHLELGSRRYTTRLKMFTGLPGIPAAVALLDVLFMGVLFFARSGNDTRLAGFRVSVPRVKNAMTSNISFLQKYVISIMPSEKKDKPCEIFFLNQPVELSELPVKLQQLQPLQRKIAKREDLHHNPSTADVTVLVMIDRSIAFEHIAPVLAIIGNAGLKCYLPVQLQTEQKDQSFEQ